jgi:hypothetical protein
MHRWLKTGRHPSEVTGRLGGLSNRRNIMKTTIKYVAPWLAAAAIGAAIALAPIASADTDPATPYGANPTSPSIFGYHPWLGDNVDVPF